MLRDKRVTHLKQKRHLLVESFADTNGTSEIVVDVCLGNGIAEADNVGDCERLAPGLVQGLVPN